MKINSVRSLESFTNYKNPIFVQDFDSAILVLTLKKTKKLDLQINRSLQWQYIRNSKKNVRTRIDNLVLILPI